MRIGRSPARPEFAEECHPKEVVPSSEKGVVPSH